MRHKKVIGVLLTIALSLLGLIAIQVPAGAATKATVVSLTFDDGDADQAAAAQTLKAAGMVGTFYITTAVDGGCRLPLPNRPEQPGRRRA